MAPSVHEEIAQQLSGASSVMLIGALDTGKTTMARRLIEQALMRGRSIGYVDADIGQSTVGPPTCAALRLIRTRSDFDETLARPDALHFVGGISPERLILQQVIATAALVEQAREQADLVVIDTTPMISGVAGESLKYHKMELCRPEAVVALQRGGELEPVVGMLRRFFGAEVVTAPVDPDVRPASPDERASRRAARFRAAFEPPLERWRVRPTVFAPTLPSGLDLSRLDGLVVGIHDADGRCQGLGRLEVDAETLRVLTNRGEGMQGLRLGSIRLEVENLEARPVNLKEVMFGL
ncbi:MAG: Clp1/GlmU family protein [Actinomycetota bacterium]